MIKQLKHLRCSLRFFKLKVDTDHVNFICYSDASYNQFGRYYKGSSITLAYSPILLKTSTGRHKTHRNSTTSVELESGHDTL